MNASSKGSAIFSPCREYRYTLTRRWDGGDGVCAWIMLNPSTADAETNDPTIGRVISFSKSWGYAGADVYNLFAFRATDPKDMRARKDPVGPDNDQHLASIPPGIPIVAAWGSWGDHLHRSFDVRKMFKGRLWCLGRTNMLQPKHPLYLPATQQPIPYPFEREKVSPALARTVA